jgi:hypothetical protein
VNGVALEAVCREASPQAYGMSELDALVLYLLVSEIIERFYRGIASNNEARDVIFSGRLSR